PPGFERSRVGCSPVLRESASARALSHTPLRAALGGVRSSCRAPGRNVWNDRGLPGGDRRGGMAEAAIIAEGLRKSFGDVHALDGVNMEVPRGTVFGLLGPNGAGKTTMVRILTTLLPPDGGEAR